MSAPTADDLGAECAGRDLRAGGPEMEREWAKARKVVGLPAFERECPLTQERYGQRRVKAYRVEGTAEAARYAWLMRQAADVYAALQQAHASK